MKSQPKVNAGAAAGSLATVFVLGAVWLGAPQPPVGFEGALAVVCGFFAARFRKG